MESAPPYRRYPSPASGPIGGLPTRLRVRVIDGHGGGIPRRDVRKLLKSHPHVATITDAPKNQGGLKATLVELRQRRAWLGAIPGF